MTLKVKLIFDDWRKKGKSIYGTPEGIALSMGDFHSGTTFDATIIADGEDANELKEAMENGYTPVFLVALPSPGTTAYAWAKEGA